MPPKRKFRPFGVRKRFSMGATMMAAITIIVWLRGFAPVCKYLPEGFWRTLCCSFTAGTAKADELDGGAP